MRICSLGQLDGVLPGGAPVFTHSADVSTASGAQEAVDSCVGNFGPLDVLICCQGSSNPLIFSEASVESLEEVREGCDAQAFSVLSFVSLYFIWNHFLVVYYNLCNDILSLHLTVFHLILLHSIFYILILKHFRHCSQSYSRIHFFFFTHPLSVAAFS